MGAGPELLAILHDLVDARADERGRTWFAQATSDVGERGAFVESFTIAARRLGKAAVDVKPQERARLDAHGVDWPLPWGLDELGRVALIVAASARWRPAELEEVLEDCFRRGDNRERQAVLRSLALAPEPERFVNLGIEACRAHVQPVFEAIACENPYPARHFPELNFNQMVLKALFTGVRLERIAGLGGRVTAELRRMSGDYASELRAAGRPLPADIGRLIGAERSHG